MPLVAMSLDVLQRNLRLLAQQSELTAQRERLRETEQFFRSVLELAPDGLMVVDRNGVIRLASARCEPLFGYTRDELIGQPVEMLVPRDVSPTHAALREQFHQSPMPEKWEPAGSFADVEKTARSFRLRSD